MIPWETFEQGLRKILTDITPDEARILQYIIGNSFF